jgi:glycosyltransferase involved in cell wall biosynthesis
MDFRKIKIAILISSDIKSGGGFQYEYMVMSILKKYHIDHNIELKYYTLNKAIIKDYHDLNIKISVIKENFISKIHRILLTNIFWFSILSKFGLGRSLIEKKLNKDKIDLVYFLSPSLVPLSFISLPYIFTLWDLGHLDLLEFPEINDNKQFETREYIYNKGLKKAYKVIVDLNYGKLRAVSKYNLDLNRIEVLKFLPNIRITKNSIYTNIKEKYNISNDYIFYPAQFWAHKNHVYILKALKILKEKYDIELNVVFSGSDKGNLNYVLDKSKKLRVDNLVNYIGFVPNDEIPHIYNQSLALVMPTYLGPTNIPPLEAFAYETSVCYSDTPFFREQVGDASFFMDLNEPESLAKHLITILNNEDIVDIKKRAGIEILENWDEKKFYDKLENIFKEYSSIRDLWT